MDRLLAKILVLVGVFIIPLIFTLLPIKVYDVFVKRGKKGEEVLSCFMCFGGGVFLATYMLHMGPDVRLILDDALIKPYNITYPVAELIMAGGFFIVLFIEKIALELHGIKTKKHDRDSEDAANKNTEHDVLMTNAMICDKCGNHCQNGTEKLDSAHMNTKRNSFPDDLHLPGEEMHLEHGSRSLVLAIALSLHRIFEGMSIGLKHTVRGVLSLTLAVLCHEIVIGFSLGLQFVKNKFSTKQVITFTFICSVIMPIGVAIGTVVVEVGSEGQGLNMANGVLQAISTGTFLYVTFFEILQGEISHTDTSMKKLIFLFLGFVLMAGLNAIPEPPEQLEDLESYNVTSTNNTVHIYVP